MNCKLISLCALALFIHIPTLHASKQSSELFSPRSLLATCKRDPNQNIISGQSGDLITAVIKEDEAPALLYAFQQYGLQPNALNKDGHPALIALIKITKSEESKQNLIHDLYVAMMTDVECKFCANAICARAGIKSDGKWYPELICSPRIELNNKRSSEILKRQYPPSSYIPHLLKIGCLVTTKSQSNDEYNGKSYQQVLYDEKASC